MIDGLKPYPAVKDSGVPWLGEIPAHWEVQRLKRLCSRSALYGANVVATSYTATGVRFLRTTDITEEGHLKGAGVFLPEKSVGDYLLADGDVLISRSGTIGRAFLYDAKTHGPCAYAGYLVRFVPASGILPKYVFLFTKTQAFAGFLRVMAISSTIENVNGEKYANAALPLPPLSEQAAIVRFLDHADRRIRKYIFAKQKLIKLLEEEKHAIILRAVTRGLDPNVQLKPSGVEWLGEVPEHWLIARLKDVATVQTGLTLGKNYGGVVTESRPYLRVANVQVGRLDLRHVKHLDVPKSDANGATLRAGDVLMTEGGDIDKLGRGCVWHDEISECLHQNHIFAVRCQQKSLVPEFLVGLMGSLHGRAYFQLTAKQTTNLASTNSTTLRAFPILLPPAEEQHNILKWIAGHTKEIDTAVTRAETEISLLREYRTRLITDVVTGKLDVRKAAARLPDEAPEPEALDEMDDLSQDEFAAEDGELEATDAL